MMILSSVKPFGTPVMNLIRKRKSVRTYKKVAISPEDQDGIRKFLAGLPKPPFGTQVRFQWMAPGQDDAQMLKGLGTYGFIKNPAGYMAGACERSEKGLQDFGYLMETVVLHLTGLGIGTCWLGGTFTKSRFSERMKATEQEWIPAVVSAGYPAEKARIFDSWVRKGAGSDKRKPWSELFFRIDFTRSLDPGGAGPFSDALEAVRLAPSASNRQPWRILLSDGGDLHFFLQRSSGYEKKTKWAGMLDLQQADMGIAMSHFELQAREAGLSGSWVAQAPGIAPVPEQKQYVITWKPR
ncbi:nitroreductase [bacterium]|nr:nitroreductase [bacterium]